MGNTCNHCQNVDSMKNIHEVTSKKTNKNFDNDPMLQNISIISKGKFHFQSKLVSFPIQKGNRLRCQRLGLYASPV